MKSNFNKYIRKAMCNITDCPYGPDLSCDECVRRLVAEHDTDVKIHSVEDFQEWLKTQVVGIDTTTNEIIVVDGEDWVLAVDMYNKNKEK